VREHGDDLPGNAPPRDVPPELRRDAEVEPTDNQAEREHWHAVLIRKISARTDSEAGSRFVERLVTVRATCRLQRVGLLDYLRACFQA